jgi:O-antigen/teichoic acid export membrane protein
MLAIAGVVVATPFLADVLLPPGRSGLGGQEAKAFTLGGAILIIASNNVITQRLLLVFNKGQLGNALIMLQATMALAGLAVYEWLGQRNLMAAVLVYLGPQILVFTPILLRWGVRLLRKAFKVKASKVRAIMVDAIGFWGLSLLAAIFLGADYYFAAHYMSSQQVVSYHLATRLFFISFVAYYAYVQHGAKRLSSQSLENGVATVVMVVKRSVAIGLVMVLAVYLVVVALDKLEVFHAMTSGAGIGQGLLFSAFLYFTIRVCRDVGLVVVGGLNAKMLIYKVYMLEVAVGLPLMYLCAPAYGGQGLFAALSLACVFGLVVLIQHAKKIAISLTSKNRDDTRSI